MDEGREFPANVTPDLYTTLKLTSHMALATYVMLQPATQQEEKVLERETREIISHYMSSMEKAYSTYSKKNWNEAQLERTKLIHHETYKILSRALSTGTVSEEDLKEYARKIEKALDTNFYEATEAVIYSLHGQIKKWKEMVSFSIFQAILLIFCFKSSQRKNGTSWSS